MEQIENDVLLFEAGELSESAQRTQTIQEGVIFQYFTRIAKKITYLLG